MGDSTFIKLATIADFADRNGDYKTANEIALLTKEAQLFDALRTLFDPGFSGLDRDSKYWNRLQRGWRRGKMDRGLGLILAINAERTKLNRKIEELAAPIKLFQQEVDAFYNKIIAGSNDVNASNLKNELRQLQDSLKSTLKLVSGKDLRRALILRERLSEQQLKSLDKIKGLDEESKTYLSSVLRGEIAAGQQGAEQVNPVTSMGIAKWLKTLGIKPRGIHEGRKSKNVNVFRPFIKEYHTNPTAIVEFFNANPAAMDKGFDAFGKDFGEMVFWAENAVKKDAEEAAKEVKEEQLPGATPPMGPEAPYKVSPTPIEERETKIREMAGEEAKKLRERLLEREKQKEQMERAKSVVEMAQEKMGIPPSPRAAPGAAPAPISLPSAKPPKPTTSSQRLEREITKFGRIQQARKIFATPEKVCPCGEQMRMKYPGNDPEDGPARWECSKGHVECDGCGKATDQYKVTSDGTNDYCRECAEQNYIERDPSLDATRHELDLQFMEGHKDMERFEHDPDYAPDGIEDIMDFPEGRERFNEEKHFDPEEVEYYKGRDYNNSDHYNDEQDIKNLGVDPDNDDDYPASRMKPEKVRTPDKKEELESIMALIRSNEKRTQQLLSRPSDDNRWAEEDQLRRLKQQKVLLLKRKNELSGLPEGF